MMRPTAGELLTGIRRRLSDTGSLRRAPLRQDVPPGATTATAGARARQTVDTGARLARVARGSRIGPAESPASVRAVGLTPRLPGTSRPVQGKAGSIEPERHPVAAVAVQTSASEAVLLLQVAVTVLSIVRTVTGPVPELPATGGRPAVRCPDPAEVTEAGIPGQAVLVVAEEVPGRAVLVEEEAVPGQAVLAVVVAVSGQVVVAVVVAVATVVATGSRIGKPRMC